MCDLNWGFPVQSISCQGVDANDAGFQAYADNPISSIVELFVLTIFLTFS